MFRISEGLSLEDYYYLGHVYNSHDDDDDYADAQYHIPPTPTPDATKLSSCVASA